MKILVTGGAGFIGSNFIRYWLSTYPNDSVINVDALTYAGCLESLADVEKLYADRYHFYKADIRDTSALTAILSEQKPDCIVNFAAESHNSNAIVNPSIFVETNVLGTQRLLEAARQAQIPRFHHISTCEVYGDLALDSAEHFSESSPYLPRTPYNASKAAADMIVRAYVMTFKVPATISNCCNNYGPYQFPEKVIPNFSIKAIQGEKLPVYSQSANKREWIHVLDHCKGIDVVLKKGVIGESYNIGTGVEVDIEGIAAEVLKVFGLDDSAKQYVKDRPSHDRRYLLDSTKIMKDLGWKPEIPFESGIVETIKWYRDNESWWKPLLSRLAINENSWK